MVPLDFAYENIKERTHSVCNDLIVVLFKSVQGECYGNRREQSKQYYAEDSDDRR